MLNKFEHKEVLITSLINGDESAFEYIFHKYSNAILANILKLVHKKDEAEDILQEVFILLWNKRDQITQHHSVAGWLFSTSYHKSLEYLKKSVKLQFKFLTDQTIESLAAGTDPEDFETRYAHQLSLLHRAIDLLPPRKKSAFTLCRMQNKTYEEAAEEMGISAETTKEYVKYAMQFIRQHLTKSEISVTSYLLLLLSYEIIPAGFTW